MGGSRLGRGDGMNTVAGIGFGLGWPPFAALIARAAFPRSMRGRNMLALWLTDALLLAVVYSAIRLWPFAAGSAASAVIAAAWLWWRWKRPDRACRSPGAKPLPVAESVARRMPPSRLPVHGPE